MGQRASNEIPRQSIKEIERQRDVTRTRIHLLIETKNALKSLEERKMCEANIARLKSDLDEYDRIIIQAKHPMNRRQQ